MTKTNNSGSHERSSGIRSSILMSIAWRNLVSKKLRTALTVIGVVIGIGAIYFLLSFGLGVQQLVTEEIVGNRSVKLIEVASPSSDIVSLDQETLNRIDGLPHVEETTANFSYPGILAFKGGEVDVVAYGVDRNYNQFVSLNLIKGRNISEADTQGVIMNLTALESIGLDNPDDALNSTTTLKIPIKAEDGSKNSIEADFQIVGVIDSGAGSEVFLPKGIFTAVGVEQYDTVRILADEASSVLGLRQQIESMGLETQSPADTLDQVNQIFSFFNALMVSLGSIGMLVAVIGMFNTITVSLLERTREIGLMVALGARRSDMRKLFVIETTLISFIGAAIGISGSIILGLILNAVMNELAAGRGVANSFTIFINPPWLIGGMLLFMIIVGLLIAFLPSRRAEKINPIDALRHE